MAILSANDPVAFTCVFGISRAGAVWCPINPRNEAAENRELLELFDCTVLIFQEHFAPLVDAIRGDLPQAHHAGLPGRGRWSGPRSWDGLPRRRDGVVRSADPIDDLAMIVGTGGTTGRPKGVHAHRHQPRDDDRASP